MVQIILKVLPETGLIDPDPEEIDALRTDLNAHVGPTAFAEVSSRGGEKGTVLEVATLVVSLLGTGAVPALVDVLKSYFKLDRVARLEISGPGGSVKLRVQVGSELEPADIRTALERALGQV